MMAPPTLHLISLKNKPIFEQLQLEEALLRNDNRNFCLINRGSPRAIVMGISGHPPALLDLPRLKKEPIPIIRRFSGGGTVIVDETTLFITFIFSKEALNISPFPEPILRWSEDLYKTAWQIPQFALRENDYAIGDKKCGGNAQYIKKGRWLLHTSFLWDYQPENMDCLLFPSKRPLYRGNRSHNDFLCRLKDYSPSPEILIEHLKKELVKRLYIEDFSLDLLQEAPHRKAVELIEI